LYGTVANVKAFNALMEEQVPADVGPI